ncbi:4Fe-4S binding domain containing protein [Tritrichomonas foetus]|uniref:Dihydrothymine dehydrogenase n=1 Tax=Tritrichomonas foetus TaxID=1144522 RepID=A0A1J4KFR3_9EUKA|nr:4Fe-4S binding domain containing protein [Tritrichomonas foetus]|eukprot:OHT08620.1 4Fe-4S binding domain containing protein [Tritrichomonas foetus]
MFAQILPSRIDQRKDYRYLTQFQFDAQTNNCLQCVQKPCSDGCPCHCSPADFIRAAKGGRPSDIDLSALIMYSMTPFSATCGTVCPADMCMKPCCRQRLDMAINIPAVQAEIAKRAHQNGRFLSLIPISKPTGKKVAIVGAGPAGLACAACLGTRGHKVEVFEQKTVAGGDIQYIPKFRINQNSIENDVNFCKSCGDVTIKFETTFTKDMEKNYDAVCWCIGQQIDNKVDVPGGEDHSISARSFLKLNPEEIKDKNIAIFGCGAVAIDCALFCSKSGANSVQIFYRRTLSEAPLAPDERGLLGTFGISVIPRTIPHKLEKVEGKVVLTTVQVSKDLQTIEKSEQQWKNLDFVVNAIGQKSNLNEIYQGEEPKFSAGSAKGSSMAAVQASASGKNAAMQIDAFLNNKEIPEVKNHKTSTFEVYKLNWRPSDISTTVKAVNNLRIPTPFIAAASPFTDNKNSIKNLLELGWGGAVMKVVADPRHVTSYKRKENGYHHFGELTAANIKEIVEELSQQYKDRLFIAQLDVNSPTLENDLAILTKSKIHAIQINSTKQIQTTLPVLYLASNEESKDICNNGFTIVDLRRVLPNGATTDETRLVPILNKEKLTHGFAVCGGCKNDNDALHYLRNGASFIEIDPSSIENKGKGIVFTNGMMSHFIHSQKCASLEEYIKNSSSSPVEIEDLDIEKLVCKLTNPYACLGCGRCTVCPNDAIDLEPAKWKYVVDAEKCVGCGLCVSRCPTEAISMVKRDENAPSPSH